MAIKFVDRVPTRPGRIKITPENGTAPWYGIMERADEPSVVGTPINAANLNAIQQNQGMSANMTIYVATSGSDSLGDGSSTSPYATITKALSTLPKNLNGYSASISIAAGTYNEDVAINVFSGGAVTLTGTVGAVVTINSLVAFYSSLVLVRNIDLVISNTNQSHAMQIYSSNFSCTSKITCSGTLLRGLYAVTFAKVYIASLTVTSGSECAVRSEYSDVSIGTLSGSVTGVGIRAYGGSRISFSGNSLTATTMYVTGEGSRIYSGAQTNIPNY